MENVIIDMRWMNIKKKIREYSVISFIMYEAQAFSLVTQIVSVSGIVSE
jgi:hypothetical protein